MSVAKYTPIYTSMMGIFEFLSLPLSIFMYIAGFTSLLYFILRSVLVIIVGVFLYFVARVFTAKDPYMLNLIINKITKSNGYDS